MNMNQFTQKTTAALQRAQSLAIEYQHMQVEQEHVMLALTETDGELIPQLLQKCGLDVNQVRTALQETISRSDTSQPTSHLYHVTALLNQEQKFVRMNITL